jgi:hypothetical protein
MEETKNKIKNGSHFSRMFSISDPKWLIIVGTILSVALGAIMPFLGIYIGKMLFVL